MTTYNRPLITDLSNGAETQGTFQTNATNLVGYYNQANCLWMPSSSYVLGNVVLSSALPNLIYECTVAGTSSSSEPAWPTLEGQTVVDGTVTWATRRQGSAGPMMQALYNAPPATITSASGVLTLTAASNYFIANGIEAITSITGITGPPAIHPAGSLVQIRWNTARTLTNSASLIIQGGANRSTQIGDIGDYQIEAGGVVREVGYFYATPVNAGVTPGIANYISSGRNFSLDATPLKLDIASGIDYISSNTVNMTANSLTLPARMASLIVDQLAGVTAAISAALPAIDAYTVGRWVFNQTGAGATIANSAVGVNGSPAVANALTPSGGLSSVDGMQDYAIQGDGLSGDYVSANYTGFPVGSSPRNLRVEWTCRSITEISVIGGYGTGTTQFLILNNAGVLNFSDNSSPQTTGYTFAVGQTYLIEMGYDGANLICLINGKQIWKVAYTAATNAGALAVLKLPTSGINFSNGILHFIDLRTIAPTEATSGSIANKLMLPCRYIGYAGTYPTIETVDASTYHEWRFAEASGTNVADSQTTSPLTGTAGSLTSIVNSDIFSGAKARLCTGGANGYITFGSYAFPTACTIIGVFNPKTYGTADPLISNRTSGGTLGVEISLGTLNELGIWNGATNILDATTAGYLNQNVPNFFLMVISGTQVAVYVNSASPTNLVLTAALNATAGALLLSYDANAAAGIAGIWEYFNIIPRALNQSEVTQYYNALMNKADRTIIDDVVPTNALSIGFAQTGSTAITSFVDSSNPQGSNPDYAYGVRCGLQSANNKRKFLGWKYFSGGTPLSWNNPFGTRKVKLTYVWAQDANGTNESDTEPWLEYSNGTDYGLRLGYSNSPSNRISIYVSASGAIIFNGAWQTSGYIGCYAEVALEIPRE